MRADKLRAGDTVSVIAPSMSLQLISESNRALAASTLEGMGLKVRFEQNTAEQDDFLSSSVGGRLNDLHAAFSAESVKLVICALGGFNSHQLLTYIDYNLIRNNPKRLCGFSDATALATAIYAKTGLITYSGPCYSNFGMLKGREYSDESFKKLMFEEGAIDVTASAEWSDDKWHMEQEHRNFFKNNGPQVIHPGVAQGTILGGNLGTLRLLYGTEFFPTADDVILFIEDDYAEGNQSDIFEFDRHIQALIQQPVFRNVRGIALGRFHKKSILDAATIARIISTKSELSNIPIICNLDFGHTTPFFTFPIGGQASLQAGANNRWKIVISE